MNLKEYEVTEEEETDFEKLYMCNDTSSDDENSDEDNGGGGGKNLIDGESIISYKDLIDNNLTELLNTMKHFPPPTEEQVKQRAVKFGPPKRMKTLIFDMDETLIHAEILPKSAPPP